MAMEENGNPEYRIDLSKYVLQQIKQLKKQAEERGIGTPFHAAWQEILWRLKHDPRDFGEFVLRLVNLQLLVHVGSVYPLTVRFAYHENLPLVYIMKLILATL